MYWYIFKNKDIIYILEKKYKKIVEWKSLQFVEIIGTDISTFGNSDFGKSQRSLDL